MNHNGTKVLTPGLLKIIPKVVEKNNLSKSVTSHLNTKKIIEKCTKVLTPGLLKIESEPINAYFKNNRVVHRDYLKVTKRHVATLQELLEEARASKPLDEHIGHASKFAERIQELLVKTVPPSSSATSTIVLPPGHILTTTVIPVDEPCPKLSLRYANARESLSRSNLNSKIHPFNLHDYSIERILSNEELPPWKFDYLGIVEIVLWSLDSGCSKHMTGHRIESINMKRYILVIVDNYSRFTWVKFLRTKDEAPEIIIKFLKQAQVSFKATVRYLCTDNGTEFVNQTLRNYTKEVGITHNTSTVRTPQQNSIVERCNHTLVEGARTMLIFSKSPLFLWAEDVATACYTQNCSFIHTRYNKTPYELLRDRKPELKYLQVFGALCYPTNNFKDLGKLQPKAEIGIFIGYSPSKKAYRIYNKRTRLIMVTMNVQFNELTQMASE
ncbi:retrovirus-related pol polyprotein from transposon TNT 1-94 [Tanacetum coccineum]